MNDFYNEEVYNEETQEYENGECLFNTESHSYTISENTITTNGDTLTFTIEGNTLTLEYTEEYEVETYTYIIVLTRV